MKKYLLLLSLFSIFIGHSQSEKEKKKLFQSELDSVSSEYKRIDTLKVNGRDSIFWTRKGIIVQDKLLNERLTKGFNQVVFSNSDLVDNSSAFGITQNEERTTVSVSTNFHLYGDGRHQFFLKGGINANGSGNIFNLYSNEEWRSSVGANFGMIWKLSGSGITNEEKNKLHYNNVLRESFVRDSIMKRLIDFQKGDYIKELQSYQSSLIKNDKEAIKKHYEKLKFIEKFFKNIDKYRIKKKDEKKKQKLDFNDYSQTKQNQVNADIIDELIDLYWSKPKEKNNVLRKIIKDIAYEYDKKSIKNTGYSFGWIDGNIVLNNGTFNFSESASNIESEVLSSFNALDAEKTGINKLNTVISLNGNYTINSLRGAFYGQIGTKFNSGSFLNSNLINGTAKIARVDENGLFFIEDEDDQTLGDFNSITRDLQYGSFDIYGAYFFGKKKIFGLNLAFSHRYKIEIPQNSFYRNNYSLLFGPIFRKPTKDDDTGLTFGIDIGYDNAIYNTRANDNFVARIRVGIPFKLYDINK